MNWFFIGIHWRIMWWDLLWIKLNNFSGNCNGNDFRGWDRVNISRLKAKTTSMHGNVFAFDITEMMITLCPESPWPGIWHLKKISIIIRHRILVRQFSNAFAVVKDTAAYTPTPTLTPTLTQTLPWTLILTPTLRLILLTPKTLPYL
jgi:hypothetical protein